MGKRIPLAEIWVVLVLLVVYLNVSAGIDNTVVWACLVLQYALLVGSIFRPQQIYRNIPTFMSAEFFFLFFSYLIFFYPYQLHVLGIYPVSQSHYFPGKTFADESNHAIILSAIAMVSFRAGFRALRSRRTQPANGELGRLDLVSAHALAIPVFTLQLVLLVGYRVAGWRAAGEGRYTDSTSGGSFAEGVYLGITVLSMVAMALWVFPPSREQPKRSIFMTLSVLLSIGWAIRVLLAGDRNAFLLIAIVAVGGFLTFRFRVGRWALLALCVFALTLYSAVEQFRRGQMDSLVDLFFTNDASTASSRDGDTSFNISTISLRAGLAAVPDRIDYGYGIYKVVGFAGVLPFIRGFLVPDDMKFTSSSDVLNAVLLGPSPTWGVGTNVIADVYMDFGLLSVPIVLFLLGLGVAYAQNAVTRRPSSLWRATFYLTTFALVAQMPRYALSFPVRPLLWVLLLFWATFLLSPVLAGRRQKLEPVDEVVTP